MSKKILLSEILSFSFIMTFVLLFHVFFIEV